MAVISVTSNAIIHWYGDDEIEDDAKVKTLIDLTGGTSEFGPLERTDALLAGAEAYLQASLSNVTTISVQDKTTVTSSEAYNSINSMESTYQNSAVGYKYSGMSSKNLASALNQELGTQAITQIRFSMMNQMERGVGQNGTMRAYVEMQVTTYGSDGKLLFNKIYRAAGENLTKIIMGVYDKQVVYDMFPGLVEQVVDMYIAEFKIHP